VGTSGIISDDCRYECCAVRTGEHFRRENFTKRETRIMSLKKRKSIGVDVRYKFLWIDGNNLLALRPGFIYSNHCTRGFAERFIARIILFYVVYPRDSVWVFCY
jgi:hypothetical protein